MIKIGNTDITDVKLGNTQVNKVYIGSSLIWEKSSPVLPYDAQVEYLTNNGLAYIYFDFASNPTWIKEIAFSRRNNPNEYTSLCGCFTDTLLNLWFKSNGFVFNYRGKENTFSASIPLNTQCIARCDSNKVWISYTNTTYTGQSGSNTSATKVRLFNATSGRNGNYSIYYFKMWDDNNNLVLDLIPVRVGTTGYMYDKVSGTLFGNSGTGSFVLGPDKT